MRSHGTFSGPLTTSNTLAGHAGGKRKYTENAFTARAESGTLKVKILRKDLHSSSSSGSAAATGTSLGSFLSATRSKLGQQQPHQPHARAPEPPRSPPKPRPNRKHVPIFYQLQTHSSSSTDSGNGGASQTFSASSDNGDAAPSTSTSSASNGRFSTLLSGLQLGDANRNSNNSSALLLRPPPSSNPLFTRTESDGSLFGDLLRHAFPSPQGPAPPLSFASQHSANAASGASLVSLSTAARDLLDASGTGSGRTTGAYRFNPFTALQSAIDVHQATLSASSASRPHAPYHLPHERQLQQQQQQQDDDDSHQDASMDSEEGDEVGALASYLGPPPTAPPAFAIQNSLVGGGIELQPVIANVNTYNFDWSSRQQGRPRSGSLPSVLESAPTSGESSSTDSSSTSRWKEV